MSESIEIRDRRDGGWFWIDKRVITEYGAKLKPLAIAVYAALAIHTNAREECWPSLSRIASLVGCSRSSVIRSLDALQETGLVHRRTVRTLDGGFRTNQYVLLDVPAAPVMSKSGVTETPVPSVTETPVVAVMSRSGVTETPPSVRETPPLVSQGHPNKIHGTRAREQERGPPPGALEQTSPPLDITDKWDQVMGWVADQIPPSAFSCWLDGAKPLALEDRRLTIQVRDQLVVDYLSGNLKELVTRALCVVYDRMDLVPVFVSGGV